MLSNLANELGHSQLWGTTLQVPGFVLLPALPHGAVAAWRLSDGAPGTTTRAQLPTLAVEARP